MLKINAVIDEITRRLNNKNQIVQLQQQLGIGVDGKPEIVPNSATHADSPSFDESAYFGERLSETLGKIALSGADQSAELVRSGIVHSQNHGFWLKGIRAFAYNSVGQEVKLSG
ncbi:MAG: hypothetical protein EZS28_051998 [Streblomastix strix]|uniref:Uncharacterized protein n=1 Tax=Streblomastix strix TaxID=222440 RepID=A0A5J4SQ47_9EUKA|nr:MAG: hypothetical protein EZS28_051998 [Streblomastix strix]